ncbi:NADH-quinone oxidoreductase subunit C [Opitutus terrae]|uniref:NADH-quinone oxidoreductase subunit C n=1 Tax=Opitutus terrae (strain DSM 11246 / JCM 15787 / PB90-1) TaxID=452637 RepID=B1ZRT1_OPITP|nr:NADH-quinone oxidoreductase subunit C [Opitutus terrae]ACB73774.1 NADH (or F420H2) dehydrogenase, subunit C [Opitutus terrae PB90-1]
MTATIAAAALKQKFPAVTDRASADHPAVNVAVTELVAALKTLRDEHGYDVLMDVTAIDWSETSSPRFTVVYHVYSTTHHDYVRVAADCADDVAPVAPSIVSLWPAANWHERECYDMFGIKFEGHPDLRRILMWEGYPGWPLRKEFPLAGVETALPDPEISAVTGTPVIQAPMMGGPFVAQVGQINLTEAEPRAKDESWNEKKPKLGQKS